MPIETLIIARAYSDAEVIINLLFQFLRSGKTGKYSILERNISPYSPPSHAIIYTVFPRLERTRSINYRLAPRGVVFEGAL